MLNASIAGDTMTTTLLLIDLQNDYFPGGATVAPAAELCPA